MFDVLVFLYETYYRPDACPDQVALVRKLSAVGFEEEEISMALDWLSDLALTTHDFIIQSPQQKVSLSSTRVYVQQELDMLGTEAIGFIQFLESANVLDTLQREIVVERALAVAEYPISMDKLKVIVLMVLWSQGKEPDGLIFEELFTDEEDEQPRLMH